MRLSNLVVAAASVVLASCGTLAHAVSNDGVDGPGGGVYVPSVSYTVSNPAPKVGEGTTVSVFANGQPVSTNTGSNVTSSNQSVLLGVAASYRAVSVGTSTLDISYGTYHSSQNVTVLLSADGMSAYVYSQGGGGNAGPTFAPSSVTVKLGASVEFKFQDGTHNVVFDAVSGAPADVDSSAANLNPTRQFNTAGAFTYRCTVHGEQGSVTVTP